jgi:hypothetical protein
MKNEVIAAERKPDNSIPNLSVPTNQISKLDTGVATAISITAVTREPMSI